MTNEIDLYDHPEWKDLKGLEEIMEGGLKDNESIFLLLEHNGDDAIDIYVMFHEYYEDGSAFCRPIAALRRFNELYDQYELREPKSPWHVHRGTEPIIQKLKRDIDRHYDGREKKMLPIGVY